MYEKDGSIEKRENVSFERFLSEHASGFYNGLREWCFGWKEAGGKMQSLCKKVLYDVSSFQYLYSCKLHGCFLRGESVWVGVSSLARRLVRYVCTQAVVASVSPRVPPAHSLSKGCGMGN